MVEPAKDYADDDEHHEAHNHIDEHDEVVLRHYEKRKDSMSTAEERGEATIYQDETE